MRSSLQHKSCPHLMITAGPTREALDPIRFISNKSTGTLGYAIARHACYRGWKVTLISGPTNLTPPKGVTFFLVESARQMKVCVDQIFASADIIVMAAAVCDFSPVRKQRRKIKKRKVTEKTLLLKKTPDILASLGKKKGKRFLVGFSLETDHAKEEAHRKCIEKKADLIVCNTVERDKNPFGKGKHSYWIHDKEGIVATFELCSKDSFACALLDNIEKRMVS